MIPTTTIPAILLAGVVAGVLLLGAGFLGRLGRTSLAALLTALGVGAGYVAGAILLQGKPDFGSADIQKWVILLAPLAALTGALHGFVRPAWGRLLIHAVFTAVTGALLLKPLLGSWETTEKVISCAGLLAISLGASTTLSLASDRLTPRWLAATAFAFASGSSGLLTIGGSIPMGLLAGVVSGTIGAALTVALLGFGLEKNRALVGTVGALVTILWTRGYFYSTLKPAEQVTYVVALVLISLVPLVALLAERLTRSKKPVPAVAIRLAGLAVPVAIALGLAVATLPKSSPAGSGEEGE